MSPSLTMGGRRGRGSSTASTFSGWSSSASPSARVSTAASVSSEAEFAGKNFWRITGEGEEDPNAKANPNPADAMGRRVELALDRREEEMAASCCGSCCLLEKEGVVAETRLKGSVLKEAAIRERKWERRKSEKIRVRVLITEEEEEEATWKTEKREALSEKRWIEVRELRSQRE